MNVLVVYAHPEPTSFNGAMKDVAVDTLSEAGHTVIVSDLYSEGFAAIAGPDDFTERANVERFELGAEQAHAANNDCFSRDIQAEIDRLFQADLLILQFPMWWYSTPAILKGWIDRVFAFGVTYDFGRTWDNGVMQGKRAMLSLTTSAPPSTFLPDGRNGDIEQILWPLHGGVLALCGFDVLQPFIAHSIGWSDDEARSTILQAFADRLRDIESDEPMFFYKLDDYDENSRLKADIEPGTPCQHRGTRKHIR